MPVQSVELLLGAEDEDLVRTQWHLLSDAGLPSQARHTGTSNRPHATLVAVAALDEAAEARLAALDLDALPALATWGPLTRFGREPWTLVRLVQPSAQLRRLQARVAEICGVPPESLSAPGRWNAHVTLARRVNAADLPRALGLLDSLGAGRTPEGASVVFTGVRRWDGVRRREWRLAGGSRELTE